jgi:hypothetical protein
VRSRNGIRIQTLTDVRLELAQWRGRYNTAHATPIFTSIPSGFGGASAKTPAADVIPRGALTWNHATLDERSGSTMSHHYSGPDSEKMGQGQLDHRISGGCRRVMVHCLVRYAPMVL